MRLLKTTPLPSLAIYARDAQPRSQRQLLELFAVARRCVGFPARGSSSRGGLWHTTAPALECTPVALGDASSLAPIHPKPRGSFGLILSLMTPL